MSKVRVLIVDDSAYSRQTIRKMLESDSTIEVAGIASDGIDAMAKTLRLNPDIITLDIEMPEMDGFSFLLAAGACRRYREARPFSFP